MTGGAASKRGGPCCFGDFELDFARQTLSRRGVRLKLQKQPYQVLALLVEQAPSVVSRDDIRRRVWGENVHVDVEPNINFCIRQIRGVLLDEAAHPRYIETVPREGYRFVAALNGSVASGDLPTDQTDLPEAPADRMPSEADSVKPGISRWVAAAMALVALLTVGVVLWLKTPAQLVAVTRVLPVTTYPGNEREPSLSPDGHQVAFSWDGGNGHWHIYIKLLGESNSTRLTSTEADDAFPVWSPDGKYIAFIRSRTQLAGDIMLIPSIGGRERSLHPVNFGYPIEGAKRLMAWTSDGKWLCFTSRESTESHHRLFLLSPESGATRPLLPKADANDADDYAAPAFSPDRRWLVFARFYGAYSSRLWFQRITGDLHTEGEPLAVSDTVANATTPIWLPDSKRVLFLDTYGHRVMQAEIGHPARLVYATEATLEGLTFSASEQAMVTSSHMDDDDLWILPLKGLRPAGSATRFASSTAVEQDPRFSPDGRSMAFTSDRSGAEQIWVADNTGDNVRQVTHLHDATLLGPPRWSPDGALLAFHARIPDKAQIYTVRVRDGFTKQLTYGTRGFSMPSFSADGKTLYMLESVHGTTLLYRLSLAAGSPQFLWPGLYGVESPKQNLLLYAKSDQLGIYARGLQGDLLRNPEVQIVPDYLPPYGKFQPVDHGIYYVSYSSGGLPRAFRFYSFSTKQSLDIAPVPAGYSADLTVTPDGSRLAYTTETKGNYDLVQLVLK